MSVRLLLVLLVLAVAAAGGWPYARERWWPLAAREGRVLPGLRVDGQPVPEGGAGSVLVLAEARCRALEERRVRLRAARAPDGPSEAVLEARLGDLAVSCDAAELVRRALRIGRCVDPLTAARLADRARRGQLDVPLEPQVDGRRLLDTAVALKEVLDTRATAARLDLGNHRIREERDGRALDPDALAGAILVAAKDPSIADVELPFVRVRARVTRASLARLDVSRVLASFQTYFSRKGDQGPRARNIEVAAERLDGLVVGPGQLVSFNEVVGARSEENGFKKAYEIFKGEYAEGTGGGTCQVASTLHAVAFFGGLEILERLPHSRPSAYIPAGLDATVVYPSVDLKLRNPFPFPVALHASVDGYALRMELLGADKPVNIAFSTEVLSTTPFDRKVQEKVSLTAPRRKQKGADGLELKRTRVLSYLQGKVRVETSRDVYPPTHEVWEVPPGFDASTLPELGKDDPPPGVPLTSAGRLASPPGA